MSDRRYPYCPNFGIWLVNLDDAKIASVARSRCGMWSCPYCAEQNRRIWRARIIKAINDRDTAWSFFHVTSSPYARGLELSLGRMSAGWNRLNLALKREYGKFDWVRVYEQHKDGTVHLHAVGATLIDQKFLKDKSWHCKLGYIAQSGIMKGVRPAFYATKYMTKQEDDWPKGTRRIGSSHHFPNLEREQEHWQILTKNRILTRSAFVTASNGLARAVFDVDWQRLILPEDIEDGHYEE